MVSDSHDDIIRDWSELVVLALWLYYSLHICMYIRLYIHTCMHAYIKQTCRYGITVLDVHY